MPITNKGALMLDTSMMPVRNVLDTIDPKAKMPKNSHTDPRMSALLIDKVLLP